MVVTTINKQLTKYNFKKGGNTKEYLVVHDVGIPGQTAKNNIDYFCRQYVGASAHYFVDRTSIWQLVEDNDIAWHVGDGKGKYGITNTNGIGIEMIVEKDGTIHPDTMANTRWLIKHLQAKHGIPNDKIVRHYDASRKNCPQFLNTDKKWTDWHKFYAYVISNEEDIDMSKAKELEEKIAKLEKQLSNKADKEDHTQNENKEMMDALGWGFQNGLIKGNGNGLNASGAVTFQTLLTILYRFFKLLKKQ